MIRFLIPIFIFIALYVPIAGAQTLTKVFIPHLDSAVSVKGLIHTSEKVEEVPATWKLDENRGGIILEFTIPKGVDLPNSFVSGLAIDEYNQISMSPLNVADLQNPRTIVEMCVAEAPEGVRAEQEGPYRKLLAIREKRLELARNEIKETYPQEFFERLQKLEEAFHLQSPTPLSPELPTEELAERLDILFHTIHRYEKHKKKKTEHPPHSAAVSSAQ